MIRKKEFLLGEALIKAGAVTLAHVDEALKIQEKTRGFIGSILVHKGYLDENILLKTLSDQFDLPYIDLTVQDIDTQALKKIPAKVAFHYKVLPIAMRDNKVTLLVSNPLDNRLVEELPTLLDCSVEFAIGHENQIESALEDSYGLGAETMSKPAKPGGSMASGQTLSEVDLEQNDSAIITLVNQLIIDAQKVQATDIHLEPYRDELRVRYRVDGLLQDRKLPSDINQHQATIISRIKIMANLDIAEKRLPQDGRIKVKTAHDEVDLRISVLPTVFGESIVIRILSRAQFLSLDKVGFRNENLKAVQDLLHAPYGIVFLTGPTGSGKTTTLYACLNELNQCEKKIVTIEDPVEYQLRGILQMQVNPKIGLTFSQGLKHVLRHDPDILMVGEVRDLETAEIAIRTALTGHMVFSTLHTNDAAGAITRLNDMGIEPYLAASSVNAVIAQRLVRTICVSCKAEAKAEDLQKLKGFEGTKYKGPFYKGKGCKECRDTGYKGRTAIHELLIINEAMREKLSQRLSSSEIKKLSAENQAWTLQDDGYAKAAEGITTIEEVLRVTYMGD